MEGKELNWSMKTEKNKDIHWEKRRINVMKKNIMCFPLYVLNSLQTASITERALLVLSDVIVNCDSVKFVYKLVYLS